MRFDFNHHRNVIRVDLRPSNFIRALILLSAGILTSFVGAAKIAGSGPGGTRTPQIERRVHVRTTAKTNADHHASLGAHSNGLNFELNEGQADKAVRYLARGAGYTVFLTGNEAVLKFDPQRQQSTSILLDKVKPSKRKLIESRKWFRGSPRFRKSNKIQIVRVSPMASNSHAQLRALDEMPGKTNYFIGNDSAKWRSGIPTFGRISYSQIYPGIDLQYYGTGGRLEFDFIVAPQADPDAIALNVQTGGVLSLSKSGDLVDAGLDSSFALHKPDAFQVVDGSKHAVESSYIVRKPGVVGLKVGRYDKNLPLVIDPVLAYSTYLGGNGTDDGLGVAVDSLGNSYLVGQTTSTDFPTANAYSDTSDSSGIAFISKFDPTGNTLLYSTYLGGTGGEVGNGIAVDTSGSVYVTGYTLSTDFPIVNGLQTSIGTTAANAFVARIDTTLTGSASLVYSTYLGGGGNSTNPIGDVGFAVAVNSTGVAYVTGQTTSDNSVASFPTTASALQSSLASTAGDAFLTVIDTAQSGSNSLIYSTYLGGDSTGFGDYGLAIAVDSGGNAYITGSTNSSGAIPFPTTPNAFQSSLSNAYGNVFLSQIATGQSGIASLVYSTYLGGSGDSSDGTGDTGLAVAIDPTGMVYVTGNTASADFPVTAGVFQTSNPANRAFVSKIDTTQAGSTSLVFSTFLGGSNGDEGRGLAIGPDGSVFIGGATASTDFPTTSGALQTTLSSGVMDGFLSKLDAAATTLEYSTFWGGSCSSGDSGNALAVDLLGNAYLAGDTCSTDFSTYPPTAYQTALNGTQNAYVSKFAFVTSPEISAQISPSPNPFGWNNSSATVSFTCVPGASPISSCTAPTTLSSAGAAQSVTGTATDLSSNSTSSTATANIDFTPPSLTISSPGSGATEATSSVLVTGTVSDALSGVAGVNCNGIGAVVSGSSYLCTIPLLSPTPTITVTAADLAGNASSTSVPVSVALATPSSLQVTPSSVAMAVGETREFSAADQSGAIRPDVSWSSSDPTVAHVAADGSGHLTGVSVGTVTLTATLGSLTASTSVTVASSLAAGTLIWSATPVSGFTANTVVRAVGSVNGPDLYSIESDSSYNVLVRGFKASGAQLLQSPIAGLTGAVPITGASDNQGGLILNGIVEPGFVYTLMSVSGQSGAVNWSYSSSGVLAQDFAVSPDGTINVVETASGASIAYLDAINGSDGSLIRQTALPVTNSSGKDDNCVSGSDIDGSQFGWFGPPFVGDDGTVVLEVESNNFVSSLCSDEVISYSENLSLLKVAPSGSTTYQTLYSSTASSWATIVRAYPGDVIPDGQGGWLASWSRDSQPIVRSWFLASVSDVTSSGISEADLTDVTAQGVGAPQSLVSDNAGTAYITDGTVLTSIKLDGLSQNWTYTSAGGGVSIKNATPAGGVLIDLVGTGAVQLDSTGTASTGVSTLSGMIPVDLSNWGGVSSGELAEYRYADGAGGLSTELASATSPTPVGNTFSQRAPSTCFTTKINCVVVPAFDNFDAGTSTRNINYGLYFLDFSGGGRVLKPQYTTKTPESQAYEIQNQESFRTPPDTETSSDANICAPIACKNVSFNVLDDSLNSNVLDKTLSVYQTFYVNRQQVQVFWPHVINGSTNWYGSPFTNQLGFNPPHQNQEATVLFGQKAVVEQLTIDWQNPATCQVAAQYTDMSYQGGCSTKGPAGQ